MNIVAGLVALHQCSDEDKAEAISIKVYSLVSAEIYSFATLAMLVNAIYLEHFNYLPTIFLSNETGHDYHPHDRQDFLAKFYSSRLFMRESIYFIRRWNKIRAVPSILQKNESKYVAFIDADLMILNRNEDIFADAIKAHPHAHLIVAADVIGRNPANLNYNSSLSWFTSLQISPIAAS